jgi:hypothetical protein
MGNLVKGGFMSLTDNNIKNLEINKKKIRKFNLVGAVLLNGIVGSIAGVTYLLSQPKKMVQVEVPIINKVTLDFDFADGISIASSEKVPYEFDEKNVSNTFTFESAWWEIDDELKKDIEDPNLAKKKYYRYDIFYTIANQYVDEEKFYDALDKLGNDYTALSELSNTVVGRYEVPYFEDEVDLSKKDHMSGEFYVKTNEKEIIEVEEDKSPEYNNKMLNNALIGAGVAQSLLIPEVIRHTIKKKKEEEEYSKTK